MVLSILEMGDNRGWRKVDIAVLTETKFKVGGTRRYRGYEVDIVHTENGKQGGVALIHRQAEDWCIESIKRYGYNTISAALVSGKRKWSIIGTYIPPSSQAAQTLQDLWKALEDRPAKNIILMGDLNCAHTRHPCKDKDT